MTGDGPRKCVQCGATQTSLWRKGPMGSKTLCNKCGIKFLRANNKSLPYTRKKPVVITEDRPAAFRATFPSTPHFTRRSKELKAPSAPTTPTPHSDPSHNATPSSTPFSKGSHPPHPQPHSLPNSSATSRHKKMLPEEGHIPATRIRSFSEGEPRALVAGELWGRFSIVCRDPAKFEEKCLLEKLLRREEQHVERLRLKSRELQHGRKDRMARLHADMHREAGSVRSLIAAEREKQERTQSLHHDLQSLADRDLNAVREDVNRMREELAVVETVLADVEDRLGMHRSLDGSVLPVRVASIPDFIQLVNARKGSKSSV
eukprot:GCRY01003366.1.p1 GENE.GCRY01003366.1~~GCRY01003366.1.p1  ORF type:complete len:317 (-),score=48.97 GCRY01003366.1:182-1132(-)